MLHHVTTSRGPVPLQHRHRLLEGMALCLAQKGYVDTTIAEIAGAAHVSKRTFYEHFSSKQECLVALYQETITAGLNALHQAAGRCGPETDPLEAGLRGFVQHLANREHVARAVILGVMSLGVEGLTLRRRAHHELVIALAHHASVDLNTISPMVMEGLVGILVELMLVAFERDTLAELPAQAPQVALLIRTALESEQARSWSSTPPLDRASDAQAEPARSDVGEARR